MNKEEKAKALENGLKWFTKADEDFLAAEKLLMNDPQHLLNTIGFHCQQAIEKYLKGFLVCYHVDFLFTHDLETLLQQCSLIDNDFSKFDFKNLTDFAVLYRYPDDDNETDLEEINESVETARSIKSFIRIKINFEE